MMNSSKSKKNVISKKYESELQYNDYVPGFNDSELPDPRIVDDENFKKEYVTRNYPNPDW